MEKVTSLYLAFHIWLLVYFTVHACSLQNNYPFIDILIKQTLENTDTPTTIIYGYLYIDG